jgi:hypothetical protein
MHSSAMMEDVQVCGLLQRIIEFEESDSETIHLLVFLLMQFMSRPDQVKQMTNLVASRTFTNANFLRRSRLTTKTWPRCKTLCCATCTSSLATIGLRGDFTCQLKN